MRLHLLHCNSREKQTGLKLYANMCSFVPDLSLMFSKGMEEKVCVCVGGGGHVGSKPHSTPGSGYPCLVSGMPLLACSSSEWLSISRVSAKGADVPGGQGALSG